MSTGRIQNRKEERSFSTLPLIGRIKVGEKTERGLPTSIDYFRVSSSKYEAMFKAAFGDKPTRIPIVFATDNVKEACNEHYACWDKGKFYGEGDGTTFSVWDPKAGKDGKGAMVEGLAKDDPRVLALKWEEYLNMKFIIPGIKGVLGYWALSTKAKKTSIPAIVQSFDFVQQRLGTVIGVPFDLIMEKKKGFTPGDPKNYPVVQLVTNINEESMKAIKSLMNAGVGIGEFVALGMDEKKLLAKAKEMEDMPPAVMDVEHEEIPVELLKQNPLTTAEVIMPPVANVATEKKEIKAGSKLDFPE